MIELGICREGEDASWLVVGHEGVGGGIPMSNSHPEEIINLLVLMTKQI